MRDAYVWMIGRQTAVDSSEVKIGCSDENNEWRGGGRAGGMDLTNDADLSLGGAFPFL
jgi:hypothetical protein